MLSLLLTGVLGLAGFLQPELSPVRVTVLYDDTAAIAGARADHGFSCLVETAAGRVLFDAGSRESILEHNLAALQVDLSDVDAVVLSHAHPDHAGGLPLVLRLHPGVALYLPADCPDRIAVQAEEAGARVIRVSVPVEIIPGVWTTGEIEGSVGEQALVIRTPKGPMVLLGCGHPGLATCVRCATNIAERAPYMVLGGFHLADGAGEEIDAAVRDLGEFGVERAAPGHCPVESVRERLRQGLGDHFVELGVGTRVVLSG